MADRPTSYFERIGRNGYRPTLHAGGAWTDDELHMAPVSGAIIDAIDVFVGRRPATSLQLSRVSFDILGKLPATEFDVEVRVVRPGRTIELLEATMTAGGRPIISARAWLLAHRDTSAVAGGESDRLPDPEGLASDSLSEVWRGGYVSSLDVRHCGTPVPGRSQTWLSTDIDQVKDQPVSELARFIGLIDTANGVAVRESPSEWMFPNVDLTIHLYRQPRGRWVGLDTTVTFGADGRGLTSTVLHDIHGPVGRSEQLLVVRPLPR